MSELLPIAIGIGLVVSLFLSESLGIAGAGLVVPGYIALNLSRPLTVAVTVACGFVAYALVKALSSEVIIYGRRRTILMILAGYLTGVAARYFMGGVTGEEGGEYAVIGFIIPGLIAMWLDRRGVIESISSLLTASIIVRLILILVFREGLVK